MGAPLRGNDIDSGGAGPFAAFRSDFRRFSASVGWGFELAYDGAELEVGSTRRISGKEDIKVAEFMLTVFALSA